MKGPVRHATELAELLEPLEPWISEYANLLRDQFMAGGVVMFAGNGGSAAEAQHQAAEYIGIGQPALALSADPAVLTALSNDHAYQVAFSRQVEAWASANWIIRPLLVLYSTSGMSMNIYTAALAASKQGWECRALLGGDGGEVAEHLGKAALVVPTYDVALAQEAHLIIGHAVFEKVARSLGV